MKTEIRVSEVRNVFRLIRETKEGVYVQRVSNGTGVPLWDEGMTYFWNRQSWDSLTSVFSQRKLDERVG